jgi:hypothetical protein
MDAFAHDMIDILQAAAAVATAGAFFFAGLVYQRSKKSDQIRLSESIYKDIRQLEKERSQIRSQISPEQDNFNKSMDDWRSRYFNTLEWLSYLANKNEIKCWIINEFFKDLIKILMKRSS